MVRKDTSDKDVFNEDFFEGDVPDELYSDEF